MTITLESSPATAGRTPPVQPRPRRELRRDIQGLRAVAVTLVVLYHAHVPGIHGGYVGVDVFFVISGFLITGQILAEVDRSGRFSLANFYARRMRRLLPAALLVVLATLVVARVWGPILQARSTAIDAVWTSLYAINFRLAAEGVNYQQAAGPQSPLQHFWSLAVEEQFYLVWPLLVLVILLIARRRLRPTLVFVACAGIAASLAASVVVTAQSAPTAYFSPLTRAWEFGIGALVALLVGQLERVPGVVRGPATWAGLVLIIGAAVADNDGTAFPGIAALVPVAGCALVLIGGTGTPPWRGARVILDRGPLQMIGRFSYGWYLWHWPMLILAPAVLGYNLSWIRGVEVSVLALWLAGLTYAAVERPTQRRGLSSGPWLRRGLGLSGGVALAAAAVLVGAPVVAGNGAYARPLDLRTTSSASLTLALIQATSVRQVPGNLAPSLEHAVDDVPVTESGCHLDFLQIAQGECIYGDVAGSRTVVLFGDSHAQQWDGALNAEAKALHWRLVSWTKAACPVADVPLVNPALKRAYTECDAWRSRTVARINALHPALVVASQSDSVPGRAVSNEHWAAQTVATLAQLQQSGTSVVFLADTPYPVSDVPTCVAAHLSDVGPCEVSRPLAYARVSFFPGRHGVVVSTVQSAGITVVDPIDWLCSSTLCPVIVGNTLVYRDDSHLTNTYSIELAPMLQPLFALPPGAGSP